MTRSRTFAILAWAFFVSSSATIIYLRFFEPPFLSYEGLPFKVAGPARPGESVKMTVTRCNSGERTRTYELAHWLRRLDANDPIVVLPPGKVSPIPPGCQTVVSAANVVPAGTVPGAYRVGGAGITKGAMRTVEVEWYSEPFEVIP